MNSPLELVLAKLEAVKKNGRGFTAKCPAHRDERASLSVGPGDDGRVLLKCFAGCGAEAVCKAVGLGLQDLFPRRNGDKSKRQITATYDYKDQDGKLLYQAVRFTPKGFLQRRPDGRGGWVWKVGDVKRALYRLPKLIQADPSAPVFIPEGERDVEKLRSLDLVATCNAGGAGKWRSEYSDTLKGRRVVVLPDNDDPGRKHAEAVARSLSGIAAEVTIVELPDLPDKGDVSDWLDAGGTAEELLRLAEDAEPYTPTEPDIVVSPARECPHGFRFTDLGNAERLVARHGKDLRFDVDRGRWLIWDGRRWTVDETREVERRAKESVRAMYDEAAATTDEHARRQLVSWALGSESNRRLRAMIERAIAEPGVTVTQAQLDSDKWALNCENGTIDLRAGKLTPHDRASMITKLAPAIYDHEARHEVWDKFLEDATSRDGEFVSFLQRAVGYSVTGSTAEETLLFVHGPSATGKTTFIEAIKACFGSYVVTANFESFVEQRNAGGARNDIARLNGARIVTSVEVSAGRRLAEGLVKMLTGGDRVTCRYLYREEFEFEPQFTLWLAANDAPRVRNDDEALWRRIRRVPFTRVIPQADRDPAVKATLKEDPAARSAILRWVIDGCLAYQAEGLGSCEAVRSSTRQYRVENDELQQFIEQYCVVGPDCRSSSHDLREHYEQFAKEVGIRRLLSAKAFGQRLRRRGFEPSRASGGERYWDGVRVLGAEEQMDTTQPHQDAVSDTSDTSDTRVRNFEQCAYIGKVTENANNVSHVSPTRDSGAIEGGKDPADDTLPDGWSAGGWAKHLRHLADSCEELHPEQAEKYRREAEEVEAGAAVAPSELVAHGEAEDR